MSSVVRIHLELRSLPTHRPLPDGSKERVYSVLSFFYTHQIGHHVEHFVGRGEVAPWAGLHTETAQDAIHAYLAILPALKETLSTWFCHQSHTQTAIPKHFHDAVSFFAREVATRFPSLTPLQQWGLFAALIDALPASSHYVEDIPTQSAVLLWDRKSLDDSHTRARLEHASVVKIKLRDWLPASGGYSADQLDEMLQFLQQPELKNVFLRIDVNNRFTVKETIAFYQKCLDRKINVDFFEEPCAIQDLPTLVDAGLPIAFDTALADEQFVQKHFAAIRKAKAIVIKPAVLGPQKSVYFLTHPELSSMPKVMSSVFESSIARHSLVALQAAFSPTTAAGLGVGVFFDF